MLAKIPGDFLQILGFAGAKQPTEFVEIERRSISYGHGRLPRRQGPRPPKPSDQTAKEHRSITAGLGKHCKARKRASTFPCTYWQGSCQCLRLGTPDHSVCAKAGHWRVEMKHQRNFERASDVALREVVQLSTMISDLDRLVRLLDCDIAIQEERAGISDRSDVA